MRVRQHAELMELGPTAVPFGSLWVAVGRCGTGGLVCPWRSQKTTVHMIRWSCNGEVPWCNGVYLCSVRGPSAPMLCLCATTAMYGMYSVHATMQAAGSQRSTAQRMYIGCLLPLLLLWCAAACVCPVVHACTACACARVVGHMCVHRARGPHGGRLARQRLGAPWVMTA